MGQWILGSQQGIIGEDGEDGEHILFLEAMEAMEDTGVTGDMEDLEEILILVEAGPDYHNRFLLIEIFSF